MNTTNEHTARMVTALKQVVADSGELLAATADTVGEQTRGLRDRLTQTLVQARRRCCELEGRSIECAQAAGQVVREHPYQSIGVAFGIGMLIGVLFTRK